MKFLISTAAMIGMLATASAFAQTATSVQTAATTTVAQQWAANQSSAPKTRAQVYQELVQAQKDGQIAHLNALYYGRP